MGRLRQRIFQYPFTALMAVSLLPIISIYSALRVYSDFMAPPKDVINRQIGPVSGFTFDGYFSLSPGNGLLPRFSLQSLDVRRLLHSGFEWVQIDDTVYTSRYPATGMFHRPEYIASNSIVVSETLSSRFDLKWTNVGTTLIDDGSQGDEIARRVHWSSDDEEHPANEPGSNDEFVARALGVTLTADPPVSVASSQIEVEVAPSQRPANGRFATRGQRTINCDRAIKLFGVQQPHVLAGKGWQYTSYHVIDSVFCEMNNLFVVYASKPVIPDDVKFEWLTTNGDFVGRFNFQLSRRQYRRGSAAVRSVTLSDSILEIIFRSGVPADRIDAKSQQLYSPVVDAKIKIELTGVDFSKPVVNDFVARRLANGLD